MNAAIYTANLTTCTLKIPESRLICALLQRNPTREEWRYAIDRENILQARSPVTARRLAAHLAARFAPMPPPLWELVRDAPLAIATQAALSATIKQSRLLGDFLDVMVREERRTFKTILEAHLWDEFLEMCARRDNRVDAWTPGVRDKLRQNVWHILAESGILSDTKTRRLQHFALAGEVREILEAHGETQVLRCLEAAT